MGSAMYIYGIPCTHFISYPVPSTVSSSTNNRLVQALAASLGTISRLATVQASLRSGTSALTLLTGTTHNSDSTAVSIASTITQFVAGMNHKVIVSNLAG